MSSRDYYERREPRGDERRESERRRDRDSPPRRRNRDESRRRDRSRDAQRDDGRRDQERRKRGDTDTKRDRFGDDVTTERKRDRFGDDERETRRRRRSRSRSSSDSASESSESASDSDADRRRRRREKRRKEEKRAKKERKREKKEKKRLKKTSAVTSQWGTYGIIDTSDQHNKEPEFRAWLVEERHINPETLAKDKERKEFARFVEDYNTATLPHEKYYDMEKYEIKMRLIRGGESVPDSGMGGGYDPMADMAAHSRSLKRAPVETESFLNKSQVEELRRLQQERAEVGQRKVLGISVPKNLGIRHEEKNTLYR
ncbi:hypothetical protein NCC49_001042 [Naganishia albida]|nr:hypothetical protein NCC49_001042 [Naganishia albida]